MHFRLFFSYIIGLCFVSLAVLGFGTSTTFAQEDPCGATTAGKTQAQLQRDLDACNVEIAKWTDILNNTKQESASFERDVAALTAKINAAQASIKGKNIEIERLSHDIDTRSQKIQALEARIGRGKESLAQILRKTNEIDSYSLIETLLSNQNLSEFFVDVDSFGSVNRALEALFVEIREIEAATESEKQALTKQKNAATDAKALIETQKKQVEISQSEKKTLLQVSQSKEKTYGQVLQERQAKAAQIRAALFALRDTSSIQFGDALEYANEAEKLTGVRPAFLLGIIMQESNIGQNVGSCVITDLHSGTTQSVNSGKVFLNGIHPTRDLPVLQDILAQLNRDPLKTKVSCPLSVGYGGAMGPAQFIPSTWKLYIGRLTKILGIYPDPWSAHDAFIASASLLADLGAAAGGYTAEHTAAARYYAGGSWRTLGQNYAASVMSHASNIQLNMIDPLKDL